jgi:hypothetical protein
VQQQQFFSEEQQHVRQIFFLKNVQIKAFGNLAETVETATLAAV